MKKKSKTKMARPQNALTDTNAYQKVRYHTGHVPGAVWMLPGFSMGS
jgi:hypothetical protein